MAAEEPVAALVTCQCKFTELQEKYDKRCNNLMVVAYACAYYMENNRMAWLEFVHLPFWKDYTKKPREYKDADRKLLLAMKFALAECGPPGDKRAWNYAACLKRFF